jgi:ATP-dependent protease ClpP protease subunit
MNKILGNPVSVATERVTYIQFCAPIIENSIRTLMQNILNEVNYGTNRLVILISSPGGSVFWGLTAYNFLKGLPINIDTHNIGSVDSVAIVVYCAGIRRYSVPHGRFLMHGVGFDVPQGTRFDEKTLDERMKSLRMDMENIAGVISENTGKSEEEIKKAMYEGTVLNPEQAVKFGLVHEIKTQLFPSGAKVLPIL